jgi:hypothetical protein
LNNIKTDINSIFPIIINIIKNNLVEPIKFIKLISDKPYNDELVVFVKVRIDNLKEFSKLISSKTKILDKMNTLMKKLIKIKNDKFIV